MDNRGRKIKNMNTKIRCEFSGEQIGHKPVILVKNAILYLRKLGHLVSNNPFLISLIFSFLFLIPSISATNIGGSQFAFDLSSRINMIISVCILIGASICFFIKPMRLLSSALFLIIGILFLFNGVNVIISFVIIALGVVVVFSK